MKTDAQLKQAVITELGWEPGIDPARISVEVDQGRVRVAGRVDSYLQRWTAQRAAERACGEKALSLAIDVVLPGASRRRDAVIATSAQNALRRVSPLQDNDIGVTVDAGWVTLTGTVDRIYQHQAALNGVRQVQGLTGLTDRIRVLPRFA